MPLPLRVDPLTARRFALARQGLPAAFRDVSAALDHLGYVQLDPLNICGRMHDLILRNRVAGYGEGDLMRHLHGPPGRRLAPAERTAFEHHHPTTHVLVAFPLEAWPHLRAAMRGRARRAGAWSGRLTPAERRLAPTLLAEIRARGPLAAGDFADAGRARRVVWGAASLVKNTLQKLFFHGELLIAERGHPQRRYDVPERVLPAATLAAPEPSAEETARWTARLKLRQRRLARLSRSEKQLLGDAIAAVEVEGCPPLACLSEDRPELAAAATAGPAAPVQLLAPLDPLIYDRVLTAALWGFDYTWEAYTPAAKRVRGHYALPVLAGANLVGHVEPRVDRKRGRLVVTSRSVRRGVATREALDELARWLGVRR